MFVQSFKGSALSPPIGYFSTIETSPTVKVTAVFNTKLIFVYKFEKWEYKYFICGLFVCRGGEGAASRSGPHRFPDGWRE